MLAMLNGVRLVDSPDALAEAVTDFLRNCPFQSALVRVKQCSVNDFQALKDTLGEQYVVEYMTRPLGESGLIRVELHPEFHEEVQEVLRAHGRLSLRYGHGYAAYLCLQNFRFSACRHAGLTKTC
jgi:hypothetical protein